MAKEAIGHVDCPHCGQPAAVFCNARSARLKYYRCGEVLAGHSTGCGTVQISGRSGQDWIAANMRPLTGDPLGSGPVPDPAPATPSAPVASDPIPDPIPAPESAPAPRRGLWARVIEGATGEL